MTLTLVETFDVDGRQYSLYEGDRWLLFRDAEGGAVCVGSITPCGRGLIVNTWVSHSRQRIVPWLEEAVEQLLVNDAPEEQPPPLPTGVEAAGATRTRD